MDNLVKPLSPRKKTEESADSERGSELDRSESEQLVARVLAGDKDAIKKFLLDWLPLFRGCAASVLRTMYSLNVSNKPALDDVVNEVIISLMQSDFKALQNWDPQRIRLESFLYVYCRVRIMDFLRKRKQKPPSELLLETLVSFDAQETSIEHKHSINKLMDILTENLTQPELELFKLAYIEEKTVAQLCSILDIQATACHQRLSRLRARVAKLASDNREIW